MATDAYPGREHFSPVPPVHSPRPLQQPPEGPVSALSVNAEERDGLIVLRLDGDLDTYTTRTFREHLRGYDPAEDQLVIDLAGVRLLDSTGLGALVSLRNRARRDGGRLGIICPDPHLMRLFWFTGLRPAFAFGNDLETVRSALAEGAAARVRSGHDPTP